MYSSLTQKLISHMNGMLQLYGKGISTECKVKCIFFVKIRVSTVFEILGQELFVAQQRQKKMRHAVF